MEPRLVVVTGPIASGKTTAVFNVAALARERGVASAAIDLDPLIEIVAGRDWSLVRREHWVLAEALSAAVIDRLFESEVELVLVCGPFFTDAARSRFLQHLTSSPAGLFVLLRVSLEESIRRCAREPERQLTSDPEFVKHMYASIPWEGLPRMDLKVDTEALSPEAIAATILDFSLAGRR